VLGRFQSIVQVEWRGLTDVKQASTKFETLVRLPDAVAALLRGNREVLRGFTDEEAGLLIALLTRLIANLDRIARVETSPGTPISEKGLTGPSVEG
jgi:hypothetical protein